MDFPKVAYILRWFPCPSETFVFHEVNELCRLGLPLKVYTLYGEFGRDISPEMSRSKVEIERLGLKYLLEVPRLFAKWGLDDASGFARVLRLMLLRRWCDWETAGENLWGGLCGLGLAERFAADGIEHIHAPWANGPASAGWMASLLTGLPFSFSVHAGDIYPPDGALREKIAHARFVRSENQANFSQLLAHGAKPEQLHMIFNGIPTGRFEPAPVAMRPPYVVLGLGRFVPKKGFEVLFRACAILAAEGVDIEIRLGGSGPEEERLRALAASLGISQRVKFLGFLLYDQIFDFFNSGDLLAMPCLVDESGDRDGIPTVIMEALLHGLPVVSTDVHGVKEVVRDGETGLLVAQKDPQALAQAIKRIVSDREAALAMAARGREFVLGNFDLETNCRKIIDLLVENT